MDEIDQMKIIIAILAATGSYISFLNDEEKNKKESEKIKQYLIILIRIAILTYSLNFKWPLEMCAIISIVISAVTKIIN